MSDKLLEIVVNVYDPLTMKRRQYINNWRQDRLSVSSLRRLADYLDMIAGKELPGYTCPNCAANAKAAEHLMDELVEATSKFQTRQGLIDFLVEQHDDDQRTICKLRADIKKYQSGELPY